MRLDNYAKTFLISLGAAFALIGIVSVIVVQIHYLPRWPLCAKFQRTPVTNITYGGTKTLGNAVKELTNQLRKAGIHVRVIYHPQDIEFLAGVQLKETVANNADEIASQVAANYMVNTSYIDNVTILFYMGEDRAASYRRDAPCRGGAYIVPPKGQ